MLARNQLSYMSAQNEMGATNKDPFEFDDIVDYAGATALDVGVTLINSLSWLGTLGQAGTEFDTGEILHSINEDAGRYYDQHKDLVQLSSFIGGMFIPGMAASKTIQWAKGGRTWIGGLENTIRKSESQAIAQFAEFGKRTAKYNEARNSMRLATLKSGVAEGVVYEIEFAAMMNKHAYMDNDYDLADFAIGAALGGLVAPLRLIQQTKKFKALERIEATSQVSDKAFTQPMHLQGKDAGQTLSYRGMLYTNYTLDDTTKLSVELQEQHKIAGYEHINGISYQINKMARGDKALQGKINFTISHAEQSTPRSFDLKDAFDYTPDEYIGRFAISDASALNGVETLRYYNAETPMWSTMEGIVKQSDDGAIEIITGQVARNTLFSNFTQNFIRSHDEVVRSIPEGVEIVEAGLQVTAKETSKDMRRWMAEYVSLPHISTRPITITGAAKFNLSEAAVKREAVWKEMSATLTHGDFVTHTNLINQLGIESSRAAIADPYYGQRILSEVDALAGAGINSYPSIAINKQATLSTKLGMAPFKQSVPMSDKAYHEAMIAVNRLPARIKQIELNFSSDDVIPQLQALLNKYSPDTWPTILSKDAKITLGNRTEAARFLWEEKQAMVAVGKATGASSTQIARVANLDITTAETILAARGTKLPFDESLPVARYLSNDQAKYYSQKPIQLEGKIGSYGQVEEVSITTMHDVDTLINADIAISRNIIDTSGVPQLAKFMNEVLFTPISKTMREQLPEALAATENVWNTVTSADHGMRILKEYGNWVTAYGHSLSTFTNKHVTDIKEAITPTLSAVAQHPVSRLQFSQVRQALHAIPIEDAVKLQYEEATGKIITGIVDDQPQYLKYYNKEQDLELTRQMQEFMRSWLPQQQELLAVYNVDRQLHGLPKSRGAGIWFPYSELNKDIVAYKVPKSGQAGQVELITANNAKDLAEDIAEANQLYGNTHEIVSKADSSAWNQINRYADLEQFKVSDFSNRKRGITSLGITPGITDIDNFMGSVQREITSQYRRIARASNASLHDRLDFFARRESAATKGGKWQQQKVSMPELVSKTMLNESMVSHTPILDTANNWTTTVINTIADKLDIAKKSIVGKGKGVEREFEELTKSAAEAGVPLPYPNIEAYTAALKKGKIEDVALHRIQKAQSLLVMFNLRLLEASHAAVTTASLPVILQGELTHVTGQGGLNPLKHMMEAGKFWGGNSAEVTALRKIASEHKYVQSIVAETTKAMDNFHSSQLPFEKFMEEHPILKKIAVGASDWSEGWTREQTFANGYLLAKAKSPTAPMELLAAEAYAFTQRTMGNYSPRQRPTMFQGTFGAMIGLYQTFMLTMGQNMFRYLEAGDTKAMRNLWGAQGSMFGIESLPMFQQFNQLLGGYVSDDHEDFRSTIYGAFGEDSDQSRSAAEHILFGVPSAAFGAGIYTRGTLDPRSPLTVTDRAGFAFKPAIFDAATQAAQLVGNLAQAAGSEDLGRAILQGFAAQSLWRPAARYAELGLGASFDQKGELISTQEEVSEPFAVLSRVIGARPLREQALRNLRFSNTYYNSIDKDRRAVYTKELRRIATSEPNPAKIDELFINFIESPGGTYRGWKQIYNEAYSAAETPYADRLVSDVKRQPTIQRIVDTYAQ
jgi:hypothetical protein